MQWLVTIKAKCLLDHQRYRSFLLPLNSKILTKSCDMALSITLITNIILVLFFLCPSTWLSSPLLLPGLIEFSLIRVATIIACCWCQLLFLKNFIPQNHIYRIHKRSLQLGSHLLLKSFPYPNRKHLILLKRGISQFWANRDNSLNFISYSDTEKSPCLISKKLIYIRVFPVVGMNWSSNTSLNLVQEKSSSRTFVVMKSHHASATSYNRQDAKRASSHLKYPNIWKSIFLQEWSQFWAPIMDFMPLNGFSPKLVYSLHKATNFTQGCTSVASSITSTLPTFEARSLVVMALLTYLPRLDLLLILTT